MSAVSSSEVSQRRIPFATSVISEDARIAVADVLASGWLTTGPEVAEFEGEFAALVGADHALAVSSCTAAIELALRALRLPAGARVLTSTMTFCGAVHAIVHAGLQPVLADVSPDTLMPDPSTVAEAAERAGGVHAMVVLHFAGHPAPVAEMAEAAGLGLDHVVEDAAHALETMVGDRHVGAISSATCFSFYATKNLPIGEGGMVTTTDSRIADFVRRARLHGMSRDAWRRYLPGSAWRYTVEMPGLKANMTDIQAAIGRAQLRHLSAWQERRTAIAERYDGRLRDLQGIRTPARPGAGRHAWHLYVARFGPEFPLDRDTLITELAQRGIDCSVHFIPIHHQPYFLRLLGPHLASEFPVADAVFPQIVSLPLHPALTDDEIDRVCDSIADVGAEARRRRMTEARKHQHAADDVAVTQGDPRVSRCLIVGAGPSARIIAAELRPVAEFGLELIGFLDENGGSRRRISSLPVLGAITDVSRVVRECSADVVIVAVPSLPSVQIRRLAREAADAGAIVRYLPSKKRPTAEGPRMRDLRPLRLNLDSTNGNGLIHGNRSAALDNGQKAPSPSSASPVDKGRAMAEGGPMRISSNPAENAGPALVPRVVLVGGAGYVGSVLARRLLDRRYRVTVVDALVYGDDGVRDLYSRQAFEVVKADLRDTEIVARSCRGAFAVVHLGGLVGDPACALDEQLTLDINLTATRTIAEAAREAGVKRFVFASSCAVYGASEDVLDEESVLDPVSLYARTKVESETVLRSLANADFCPVALRFATFYGLSPRPRFDLAVNLLAAKAITEGEITIFGGDQWRPFVHVEDGTAAIIAALESPEGAVFGEVFNVGSDEQNHTFRQIAEMIERHVPGTRVVFGPAAETEANYRVAFAKIRERLGFRPTRSMDTAISEIGAALRSGAIGDYLETRYSNHKTLTQGRAVADLIRTDEPQAALSAPGRVVP